MKARALLLFFSGGDVGKSLSLFAELVALGQPRVLFSSSASLRSSPGHPSRPCTRRRDRVRRSACTRTVDLARLRGRQSGQSIDDGMALRIGRTTRG